MATTTITDLPASRAMDYKAMLAIRGAGGAPWVFDAFRPFVPESDQILPIVNVYQIYQTNLTAQNLTLETENINVQNSAANSTIAVAAVQNNALNIVNVAAAVPRH